MKKNSALKKGEKETVVYKRGGRAEKYEARFVDVEDDDDEDNELFVDSPEGLTIVATAENVPRRKARSNRGNPSKQSSSTGLSVTGSNSKSSSKLSFWGWLIQYVQRVFYFPFLTGERICFHREDLDAIDAISHEAAWQTSKEVEDLVNFESLETKNKYANILEERKRVIEVRNLYHTEEVDLKLYPRWDEDTINLFRATFRVFDISGDGAVDFEEFCEVLADFGDKTSQDILYKFFSIPASISNEQGSVEFNDFLKICYEIMEKNMTSPADQPLRDTFQKIRKNMEIRCRLNVCSQLQGGLF